MLIQLRTHNAPLRARVGSEKERAGCESMGVHEARSLADDYGPVKFAVGTADLDHRMISQAIDAISPSACPAITAGSGTLAATLLT